MQPRRNLCIGFVIAILTLVTQTAWAAGTGTTAATKDAATIVASGTGGNTAPSTATTGTGGSGSTETTGSRPDDSKDIVPPYRRPESPALLVSFYALLLSLFVAVLMIWNMRATKSMRRDLLKAAVGGLSEQGRSTLDDMVKAEAGPGMARSALSFSLVLILGIVVFHLIVFGGPDFKQGETGKLVHDLVMLLAGVVASITAFYFGGRAVQEGAAGSATPVAPASTRGATILKIIPEKGAVGASLIIVGTGFGLKGQVKIGGKEVDPTATKWAETTIETKVPAGLTAGPTTIVVNPEQAQAATSPQGAFSIL